MYKIEAVVAGPFFPVLKDRLINLSTAPAGKHEGNVADITSIALTDFVNFSR